jgi:hypothetical protein
MKRVPDEVKERRMFFTDNADSEKYYYMPIGDFPHDPNRNTLVPLGKFLGFFNPHRWNHANPEYYIRFSNPPYDGENTDGPIHMNINPLVYTDLPPAAASVPLLFDDYNKLSNEEMRNSSVDGKGKKTRNRKNIKLKKTRNRKNIKLKKTRKHKRRRGRK